MRQEPVADRMEDEERIPAEAPETRLNQCVSHVKELLFHVEQLQRYGESESPKELAAEYSRIRKDLDNLILDDEEEKFSASRRQSFQMAPVKAYLRRAKYSWKDWILLSPINKSKREEFTMPELHDGNDCPFPGCQAHTKPSKDSPHVGSSEEQRTPTEKELLDMPGHFPGHAVATAGEEMHPSARFLNTAPGPHPNLSFTTIYTDEDDSSSCHSCSTEESVSSFCVVGEGSAKGQSPSLAKAPSSPAMSALPKCMRTMPKSAHDALRLWTTLLG